jgi:preprotein translocase subunit SecG
VYVVCVLLCAVVLIIREEGAERGGVLGIAYFGIAYFGIAYFGIAYFEIAYFGIAYFIWSCLLWDCLLWHQRKQLLTLRSTGFL